MVDAARFWDKHAEDYAKRPVADEASYDHKLSRTRARLGKGQKVLEIGCGTGTTALRHAPHVSCIRAMDISPRMLEIARRKAEMLGIGNVLFETADMHSLAARAASYDVVMAHSILHLLRDRREAVAMVARVLKPGGLFISSTPCLAGWRRGWLRYLLVPARWLGLAPRVNFFTAGELATDVEAGGFAIEERWQPGPGKPLFLIARKS